MNKIAQKRKLLISVIEKVRYGMGDYDMMSSSQIAEQVEKQLNAIENGETL